MLRTYEAVYRKGRQDWITPDPRLAEGARVVVVVEERRTPAVGEATRQALDAAWARGETANPPTRSTEN